MVSILKYFLINLLFLVFIVGTPLFIKAQVTTTITVSADCDIDSLEYYNNFGSCNQMWIGSSNISRGLFYFDLSLIPSGVNIISADLKLYTLYATLDTSSISVHQVLNNWDEGSGSCTGFSDYANWTQSQLGSNWNNPGGDFYSTPIASVNVSDENFYIWDVKSAVQNWVLGSPNYGLMLKYDQEGTTSEKRIATRENANTSYHPTLTITYSFEIPAPIWHIEGQKQSIGAGNLITVDKPDDVLQGDLIILILSQQNSPNTPISSFVPPSGFVLIKSQHHPTNSSKPEVAAFYKIATENEPDFYSITVNTYLQTPKWKALTCRVTGHNPTNPIFASSGTYSNLTSTTSNTPALSPTVINTLLVAARTVRRNVTNENTPTGMTLRWTSNGTGNNDSDTNQTALRVASQTIPNTGSTNQRSFTWSNPASSAALMFIINPLNVFPGGISTPILWLRASWGVIPSSDQSSVSSWRNYYNTQNFSQSNLNYYPILNTQTNLLNFNSTLKFDGTNDYLIGNNNFGVTGGNLFTNFNVVKRLSNNTIDEIWGANSTQTRTVSFLLNNNLQYISSYDYSKSGSQNILLNTPLLLGVNRSAANTFQLYFDGFNDGISSSITGFNGSFRTVNLNIGSRNATNRSLDGLIGEIIIYNTSLTTNSVLRINSYLAIKYGISMNNGIGNQYIASDGSTVFWNNTLNTGYNYGIFGIGRDNVSSLHQQISHSSNTNDILTISTNFDFITPNSFHNVINFDLTFVMFGNNNASLSTQISEINNNIYNSRISREWKVQNTNFNDTICLKFDGIGSTSLSTAYLIKKNNNSDFSTGTTEVGALNTNGEITGVTFNNNDYFTIAFRDCAPGGVAQTLQFWVKADNGTVLNGNKVTQWVDQSGNNRDLFQVIDAQRPILNTNSQNFNPTIQFNASSTQFFNRNSNFNFFSTAYSIYFVGYSTDGQRVFITIDAPSPSLFSGIHIEGNANFLRFLHRNPPEMVGGDNLITGTFSNNKNNLFSIFRNGTTKHKYNVNGIQSILATITQPGFTLGQITDMTVGKLGDQNTRFLNGDISEILIYNTDNESDKARIESYLALKYGISLNDGIGTHYIASDGSTIFWNYSSNSGFNYDIFGIGRDDRSCLHQKQSKSTNSDFFFTVYHLNNDSEIFPITNKLNSSTIPANYSFLMFGNNNGDITEWFRFDEMPPFLISRIERVWKVQKTGNINNTVIAVNTSELPINTGGLPLYLIISSSPTLENAEYYLMELIGNTWRVAYNFENNTYISFGYGVNLTPMRHSKGVVEGEKVPYK